MRMLFTLFVFFSLSFGGSCFTAKNGFKSIANTEKKIISGKEDLMSSIDNIHSLAKKRADLELKIVRLNNQIEVVRKSNLRKLKRIEFFEGNKYVTKNTKN